MEELQAKPGNEATSLREQTLQFVSGELKKDQPTGILLITSDVDPHGSYADPDPQNLMNPDPNPDLGQ